LVRLFASRNAQVRPLWLGKLRFPFRQVLIRSVIAQKFAPETDDDLQQFGNRQILGSGGQIGSGANLGPRAKSLSQTRKCDLGATSSGMIAPWSMLAASPMAGEAIGPERLAAIPATIGLATESASL
jgi:hypothetical protein